MAIPPKFGISEVEYLLYTTQNNCTLTLDVDGISTGTIAVPAATSWQTPILVNGKAGFPTAGTHKIVLRLAGDMNLNGMTFSSGGSASLDADFTASPTSGPAPLRVYFTDNSTGTPTAWNWTFGDGDTAKIRDLLHTYTTPGTYTVSLTVSDAAGSDTETKTDYITVENGSFSFEWQRCLGGSYNDEALSVQQTVDGGYVVFGTIWSDDGDVSGHHGGLDIWMVKLDSDGALAWQRCLGGSGGDILPCVRQTSDDGYIVVSATDSTDGDVSGNHGDLDIWVVKLDSSGAIEWQRCLGGSSLDSPSNVLQTSDGGYIVVGDTQSNDGDVAGYHGHIDIWVVKLDNSGAISWQRCLGGSMLELTEEVQQTSDGGYIFAGETESTNGDVIGIHGGFDVWVVKLDSGGAIAWQRCLGGSGSESTMHIQQTPDGGYIFAGGTDSIDGDVIGNHGGTDIWVVKLDSGGAIVWQRCLGGSDGDYNWAASIFQTVDGGYVVSGLAESNDGNVSGNHGDLDAWVVKLNAGGTIEWQRCLGGSLFDYVPFVQQTSDGGYIFAGETDSIDGDVIGNHGGTDIWVVNLDSSGAMAWQLCLGGSNFEDLESIQHTSDGGYILAGDTTSTDGDVSGNHGSHDAWVVKLKGTGSVVAPDANFTASPTSGQAPLTVNFTDTSTGTPAAWLWTFGDGATSTVQHPVHTYTKAGMYTVSLTADNAVGSDTETKIDYITAENGSVSIEWQHCLGGLMYDQAKCVQKTSDGGYIVAGETWSTDGDVIGSHGEAEMWVVKLDNGGDIEWQRCLGGSGNDYASSVRQTSDGGYIVVGGAVSADGDVTVNHGHQDLWVVKLDASGTIEWQHCLGGSNYDWASSVQQTSDGGYIIAGETDSTNGDVTGNHGNWDVWVVKMDSNGAFEWQRCLGGSGNDYSSGVQQTVDGGYIVAGETDSTDGDVTVNNGKSDVWVVKLDADGNIGWQRCFGGSEYDQASGVQQTTDGGYIVAGEAGSTDGDVIGNHGGSDSWVMKLDAGGNIEWQRCLGGSGSEGTSSVQQTIDGGYVVVGATMSTDGNVAGNHGGCDSWVVKLDAHGMIERQCCLGGSEFDRAWSVQQTVDGGYIVAGSTDSNNGDVSGNHGGLDIWVVKLKSA